MEKATKLHYKVGAVYELLKPMNAVPEQVVAWADAEQVTSEWVVADENSDATPTNQA